MNMLHYWVVMNRKLTKKIITCWCDVKW